jgi:predicted CoA-substrate-specific enzyme activase
MSTTILGIDIGSISLSVVELNRNNEILNSTYSFHHGEVRETLLEILDTYDLARVRGIATTSSASSYVKNSRDYDSRIAYISAAKMFYTDLSALLVVGGEKFGLAVFDDNGDYLNYRSNSSCAAGTGSFLDQQAKRLNISSIEEFTRISLSNGGPLPGIASRCAVFAKTDLIHAQQEGYSLASICDGLSYGLAKSIYDTLFSGNTSVEKLIFTGGVSKNSAVAGHLSTLTGADITTHPHSHIFGAIGAALNLQDEEGTYTPLEISVPGDIVKTEISKKSYYHTDLDIKLSDYPEFTSDKRYLFRAEIASFSIDVEVDLYSKIENGKNYSLYLGIDIGSTSTKAVLVDLNKDVLAGLYTRTSGRPVQAVQALFSAIRDIQEKHEIDIRILGSASTGSGRKFIGKIINADIVLDEITAHARAAYELDSEVDTIIEIGGQDSKFTTMKNGMVTFSIMNNVCAAGTGSFIEEQAKKLDCPVEEYSERALNSKAPLSSDRCTVFMERDLNHYISDGYEKNEILASALHSVRDNYLSKVATEKNIGEKIFFQGATAKNRALVAAFEQKLQKPIMVSKYCHLTGALGSALTLHDNSLTETAFRGLELYKKVIEPEYEVCSLCNNSCKISLVNIDGEKVAYGFLCGRDYETAKYVKSESSGFELLKTRKRIFRNKENNEIGNSPVVGIPASLHLAEDVELWERFFNLLSIKTVTSSEYANSISDGKNIAQAEFCAPMASLHGHIDYLSDRCDFIFLPTYIEEMSGEKEVKRNYCYYTQFAPSIILSNTSLKNRDKILTPVIRSLNSDFNTRFQLFNTVKSIKGKTPNFLNITSAYDRVLKEKEDSYRNLRSLFKKELQSAENISVMLLGRPYSVLNESMNSRIPDIFNRLGIKAFFQDMLEIDKEKIKPVEELSDAMHWKYTSEIVEAAQQVAETEGLYPVLLTSFKCTPDAFLVEYFKDVMDSYEKPYLILQLDEHNSNVGYETRIESCIRSFNNHHMEKKNTSAKSKIDDFTILTGSASLKDKTLLIPNWDNFTCSLLEAVLKKEGVDARVLEETDEKIQLGTGLNSGQCLPLSIIAYEAIDYINTHNLKPENCAVWAIDSKIACNLGMFSHYIKKTIQSYDEKFRDISVYAGEIVYHDISFNASLNSYFAYMFSGLIKKIGCSIRPYENKKGETNRVIEMSRQILIDTFLNDRSKETTIEIILSLFEKIERTKTERPKVALIGDLYVRDNDVMNQNLVEYIEEQGGEVITTPYNEFMKIIAETYLRKWMRQGKYLYAAKLKMIKTAVELVERKYNTLFNNFLDREKHKVLSDPEKVLARMNVTQDQTGESVDNILKIFHLMKQHPDTSLFVQTNPSYCCPSLVTEAMTERFEELTGVPIVTIEYDGTSGSKNNDIIPYLRYPRKKKNIANDKAV